jgi:nicotinamidase-related amidase
MRIVRENTACLVIDIQEKLFPVMHGKDDLLKNCRILISGMQALHIPLTVTQQYTKGLGKTIPEISSLIADFSFIEKRDFSCCGEPEVMQRLKRSDVKNIVLCGIESHVCVLQTALDLKEAGWMPVVVADAMTSRYRINYKLALERFRYEGMLVTSAESLLFELTRTSSAPEFKFISALIK